MKLLPYILLEKYIYIAALETAVPRNQHCANCIGTLSFPVGVGMLARQTGTANPTGLWVLFGVSDTRSCAHM